MICKGGKPRKGGKIRIMNVNIPHSGLCFARANGIEIAYDTFGVKGDDPILLIMGLSAQMILWEDEFCEGLAGRGFYVIRFDNRDVGMSTKMSLSGMPHIHALLSGRLKGVGSVPYTLSDMAEDTIGLLDDLQIENAHIVGASMGGMIGQEVAMHYPKRIKTFTSIMSTTGNPLLPPPRHEALEMLFRPIPTSREAFVEYFKDVWRILSGPRFAIDEPRAARLGGETYRRGMDPAGNARQLAAILASGSRKDGLAFVKAPTLVIHGTDDPLVSMECGVDTAQSIPGARLKIMDGMGHWLPPRLWPEIIDAIAGHTSETRS
jgi:pimeloyl-ACP methyl ester carboxylesterase